VKKGQLRTTSEALTGRINRLLESRVADRAPESKKLFRDCLSKLANKLSLVSFNIENIVLAFEEIFDAAETKRYGNREINTGS